MPMTGEGYFVRYAMHLADMSRSMADGVPVLATALI